VIAVFLFSYLCKHCQLNRQSGDRSGVIAFDEVVSLDYSAIALHLDVPFKLVSTDLEHDRPKKIN
jgi:hypothetical protein